METRNLEDIPREGLIDSLPPLGRNKKHDPRLKPKEKYALRHKQTGRWVRDPHCPILEESPSMAKLYWGFYLNHSIWDYSLCNMEAVPMSEVMKCIAKEKKEAPKPEKSKGSISDLMKASQSKTRNQKKK